MQTKPKEKYKIKLLDNSGYSRLLKLVVNKTSEKQYKIADKLGVTKMTFSQYLNNKRSPKISFLTYFVKYIEGKKLVCDIDLEENGEYIRSIIKDSNYTQKEIAKQIGISPNTLVNYVYGRSLPTAVDYDNIMFVTGNNEKSFSYRLNLFLKNNNPVFHDIYYIDKDKKNDVAQRMKNIVDECNLTRSEICKRLGISLNTLISYLSGKTTPDFITVNNILFLCSSSWDELFGIERPTQKDKPNAVTKEIEEKLNKIIEYESESIKLRKDIKRLLNDN